MTRPGDVAMRADTLRAEVAHLRTSLCQAESALSAIEAACPHQWSEPVRGSERFMAESVGPLVVRGSDAWHEPRFHESTRTIWTRTCALCHRTETTRETKPVTREVPAFR